MDSDGLLIFAVASLSANLKAVLNSEGTTIRFANRSDHDDMKKRWRSLIRLAGDLCYTKLMLGILGYKHQW